ncbi:MAG: hypothetical protein HN348_28435 [Proteobacteria bacterium]|nr:hypothetical protein [Pseudomonadota bacterium]
MTSRYPQQEAAIRGRYESIKSTFDERSRRLFAASEAKQVGFGGVSAVHRATGIARSTIQRGLVELADLDELAPPPKRQRRAGGGRPRLVKKDPGLLPTLKDLVDAATRGDPESPLLWLSKSGAVLTAALQATVGEDLDIRENHALCQSLVDTFVAAITVGGTVSTVDNADGC